MLDEKYTFLNTGELRNCSQIKREFFIKAFGLQDMNFSSLDVNTIHTAFTDSLITIINDKYKTLIKPYNMFAQYGFFKLKRNKTIDDETLQIIKLEIYDKMLKYYNDILVPILNSCLLDEKYNIHPNIYFKFSKLPNNRHLI